MNPQDMMTAAGSLLQGHLRNAGLIVLGAVLSNPIVCAQLAFSAAMKVPYVGPWVAAHPEQVKAWFDGFDKAIDACVDKYVAKPVTPTDQKPS